MITTLKTNQYEAFGFQIKSVIPLPELQEGPMQGTCDGIDIQINFAELSTLWDEANDPNRYFYVQDNSVLFRVPEVAIYRVENGANISVSPYDKASLDKIRLYLLGTCMGIILMQRKILPLHGSAVVIDGKAYAIVGDSGAGKSTLASAFLKKGYQLVSDDVIPVSLSIDRVPFVTPAYPQQKLWEESLAAFNMDSAHFKPIIDREQKFAVPVDAQFATKPLQLAGIYELVKRGNGSAEISPIVDLVRFQALFDHTYRNFLLPSLDLLEWHFKISAIIINGVAMYQIRRPDNRFTADELTKLILNTIEKREE